MSDPCYWGYPLPLRSIYWNQLLTAFDPSIYANQQLSRKWLKVSCLLNCFCFPKMEKAEDGTSVFLHLMFLD